MACLADLDLVGIVAREFKLCLRTLEFRVIRCFFHFVNGSEGPPSLTVEGRSTLLTMLFSPLPFEDLAKFLALLQSMVNSDAAINQGTSFSNLDLQLNK